MQEIRTSGSMSGDGKRSVAAWPKLPRPSSTLPKLPKPMWAACPVLAKADTRPAYRAAVSLARLSPPCQAGVALKPGALVEQQLDVLAAQARVELLAPACA